MEYGGTNMLCVDIIILLYLRPIHSRPCHGLVQCCLVLNCLPWCQSVRKTLRRADMSGQFGTSAEMSGRV